MDDAELIETLKNQSFLEFFFRSLGLVSGLILLVSFCICGVLALRLMKRGKGQHTAIAVLAVMHLPLLFAAISGSSGLIQTLFATARETETLRPYRVSAGMSHAIVISIITLLFLGMEYLVVGIASSVRAFTSKTDT